MNKVIFLIPLITLLVSCSTQVTKKQTGWHSDDTSSINRTKELFACSRFFKIVAMQRPSDREKYEGLANKSGEIALLIMPSYKESGSVIKSELIGKYSTYGKLKAATWVKSIGKDKSKKLFPKITTDCVKTVQQEDLLSTIRSLSNKAAEK